MIPRAFMRDYSQDISSFESSEHLGREYPILRKLYLTLVYTETRLFLFSGDLISPNPRELSIQCTARDCLSTNSGVEV